MSFHLSFASNFLLGFSRLPTASTIFCLSCFIGRINILPFFNNQAARSVWLPSLDDSGSKLLLRDDHVCIPKNPVKINNSGSRNLILESCSLESALSEFLDWIQDIYFKVGKVILVSHGCIDIPVLYQSFCEANLDDLFLQRVTDFVNFQDYLKAYYPQLPLALSELGR